MKKIILSLVVASMLLSCCTSKNAQTSNKEQTGIKEDTITQKIDTTMAEAEKEVISDSVKVPHIVGGDRDEHGCIPSAGYVWCEKLGKCIRPWEEKCE